MGTPLSPRVGRLGGRWNPSSAALAAILFFAAAFCFPQQQSSGALDQACSAASSRCQCRKQSCSTSTPPTKKKPRRGKTDPPKTDPPKPDTKCPDACEEQKSRSELLILLTNGRTERDLGHWDKAADLYAKAMAICLKTASESAPATPPAPNKSTNTKSGTNNTANGPGAAQASVSAAASPLSTKPSSTKNGSFDLGAWLLPWRWPSHGKYDWILPWRWGYVDDARPADPGITTNFDVKAASRAAEANFRLATAQTRTWWWNWGAYFPPLRWVHSYPRRFHWGVVVLFFLAVFTAALLPRLLPRFPAHATIIAPAKLTKDAETDLFAQALASAGREISALFMDPDLGAGSVSLRALPSRISSLTIPSTLATSMKDLPDVKGVGIGGIVKVLSSMSQYFRWRLESALAFSPAIEASNGRPAAPPRMRAFASVRWAWFVWTAVELEREVWDQYDVDPLAVAIVARIRGEEI